MTDPDPSGCFVALEGGEGAGKSTQARRIRSWLESEGREVVLTHEPGDTMVGREVRRIVLDPATGDLSPRTEALLYAADKAEHVERVVEPALRRGAVVVCDRYVDSTIAYQGGGRDLDPADVEQVARWATRGLRPDLTVLLDLPPAEGLARFAGRDRIEAQSRDFHQRVRETFLRLAAVDADHYLVLDATAPADAIESAIRERLLAVLGRGPGSSAAAGGGQ